MPGRAKLKTAVFEGKFFAQHKLLKKPMPSRDRMGFFYVLPARLRERQDSSSNHQRRGGCTGWAGINLAREFTQISTDKCNPG